MTGFRIILTHILGLFLSIECFHLSFFRLANFQQLSPSNSESSFNSMEDFSNGAGNGPHNHEDSDTGMVRYLYLIDIRFYIKHTAEKGSIIWQCNT